MIVERLSEDLAKTYIVTLQSIRYMRSGRNVYGSIHGPFSTRIFGTMQKRNITFA